MATNGQVRITPPVVGVELNPSRFAAAATPEVIFPTEYDSLKITNAEIENISGSLNGLPAAGSVTLNDVTDVDATNPADFSILQYNGISNRWVAIANTDFVDAVIDGGSANSDPDYVAAFDLDGGNA
tara:strand:- start:5001 stop:5381 length:381 start_codon:yes stop_codon:yes gene_type:complete